MTAGLGDGPDAADAASSEDLGGRSGASALARAVTAAIVVWLGALAAWGVLERVRSQPHHDASKAWSFLTDDAETRFARHFGGRHFPLLKAILDHVPAGEAIVYHAAVDPKDELPAPRFREIGNVVYPRRLVIATLPVATFPTTAEQARAWGGYRYVLERNREVAFGPDFELLHDAGWVRLVRLREDA